jgi:flavin-dependent thymidylate synthase
VESQGYESTLRHEERLIVSKNKNKVELIGYYGGDELHACSAWTSTSRDLDEEKRARIPQMLKTLAEAGHHTPFEKSTLHFLVDSEIASHIHLLKHRVGVSLNAESARYKELKEDKFYIPADFYDVPVSPELELGDYKNWGEVLAAQSAANNLLYHACLADIVKAGQGRKRAKESARFFKMYNSQIESDVMFNWRSFAHFVNLRNSAQAQREIMFISSKMLSLVTEIPGNPFKYTIEAFGL